VSEGIDYWLSRFADGWRPGFYYLTLNIIDEKQELPKLLFENGVAFRTNFISYGSLWTWARCVKINEFIDKFKESTALLLQAEILDSLHQEIIDGKLKGCQYVHLGEFRSVQMPLSSFIEQLNLSEEQNTPTQGDFWVYLPLQFEQKINDSLHSTR
jgi:hypothetical protein